MTAAATAASRAATDRLQAAFERAAETAGGPADLRLRLAGESVLVRFAAARAAEALGRAFAHVRADDDGSASLTLHVWDGPEAASLPDAVMPVGAVSVGDVAGASYVLDDERYRALHQPAYGALTVLAASGESGWFCVPDLARLPPWEYASPFRHVLSWWLARRDCTLVHGGAVGTERGGVLLVGRGGSGKSTTTLAVLADGRRGGVGVGSLPPQGVEAPLVRSLYSSGKMHRRDLARLPHLQPPAAPEDDPEKAIVYAAEDFPGRTSAGFPLRAIVLPRVTDRRTARAAAAGRGDALAALAPSTIFQIYPPARESLTRLAALVQAVPSFVLELGADVASGTDELVRLLEELDA